jgi:hypothetical protein
LKNSAEHARECRQTVFAEIRTRPITGDNGHFRNLRTTNSGLAPREAAKPEVVGCCIGQPSERDRVFSEEQIAGVLKRHEAGRKVAEPISTDCVIYRCTAEAIRRYAAKERLKGITSKFETLQAPATI